MAPRQQKQARARLVFTTLRSCLVNLPGPVSAALHDAGEVAQNVAVELEIPSKTSKPSIRTESVSARTRSLYVGWTGLTSKAGPAITSAYAARRNGGVFNDSQALVEIDAVYGRQLGLYHGQEVALIVHLRPPEVTTINVEPVTAQDWTTIELHAGFLEEHLLSQLRVIPNPSAFDDSHQPQQLTIHLSPTSTANLVVASTSPAQSKSQPFLKIAPNAEVIVAPKSASQPSDKLTSFKRTGARPISGSTTGSGKSTNKIKRVSSFFRGVDRSVAKAYFDTLVEADDDIGFRVWIPRDLIISEGLQAVDWVFVTVIEPRGLQPGVSRSSKVEEDRPEAARLPRTLVARLHHWQDAPDGRPIALSSALCISLSSQGIVGGIIGIRDAISQRKGSTKKLGFHPFRVPPSNARTSLRIGDTRESHLSVRDIDIRTLLPAETPLSQQPLVDGMLVRSTELEGNRPTVPPLAGTLHFGVSETGSAGAEHERLAWVLGSDCPTGVQLLSAQDPPLIPIHEPSLYDASLDDPSVPLVGIDQFQEGLMDKLRESSVLLTGPLGCGKTVLLKSLQRRMKRQELWHCSFLSCVTSFPEEKPVSFIKETLSNLFAQAGWSTRLGGHAVVLIDDIDHLCPAETELQVGDQNGRSRQQAEMVIDIVRSFCHAGAEISVIFTARGKEDLHLSIISSHIYRHHESVRVLDRTRRAELLEHFCTTPITNNSQKDEQPGIEHSNPSTTMFSHSNVDFLLVAGKTDGYVARDLQLLAERAKVQALIRITRDSIHGSPDLATVDEDFEGALAGFTPASLRNVNLQSSQTTWSAIGGLHQVRKTLLETIQFPTLYAPVFENCPLRLRSGLLLYGYPGCGKTLLASAVAGQCGLNFISVKGPEILNKYIGASEKSIRDLFDRAGSAKPCVLFFDEFESIAPRRGHDSTGVTDRVVNQLLTEMDGAEGLSGVYILAATSRPDLIDPALLRPGRLDKSLLCGLPNEDERLDILHAVGGSLTLSPSLKDDKPSESLRFLAQSTKNYSGADLQAVMYNAHLEAVHDLLGQPASSAVHPTSLRSKVRDTPPNFLSFTLEGSSSTIREDDRILLESLGRRSIGRFPGSVDKQRPKIPETGSTDRQEPVIIQWIHIQKALTSTRPSIPQAEREKLSSIYRAFTSDRTGDGGLPDGQASMEIGGRISLM